MNDASAIAAEHLAAAPAGAALAIADAVARGERSASEVVAQCLARIAATEPRINAFTTVLAERARAEAAAIDRRRAAGEALPPLAGVPFAVKNLFDLRGVVTLAGSRVLRQAAPASADSVLVQRLCQAGAVPVGALNMDEFAYGFTTENSHAGPTRNPHDPRRSAGGSSGGSGAAVAAEQVPIALGSDTNGSIRVPSSLCGVWGLKPTFGRLSRRGSHPFVHSLDHLGPFADSVTALATCYDALQFPDAADPACHARAVEPALPGLAHGVRGLRIGLLDGWFHDHAGPEARAVAELAARTLGAGDTVRWPLAAEARAAAFITTASEGAALHLAHLRTQAEAMEPLSVDRFIAGALQPAAWYVRAQRFRRLYRDRVHALFRDWDLLLAPATPVSAPLLGAEWIEVNGQQLPCRPSLGLLTQPISYAGCPVVAAPMWPADGRLPLGVQLIAAPGAEALALRAARVLEAAGVAGLRRAPA